MELYLIRHAHAVDEELGQADGDRALSASGRRDAQRVGELLAGEKVSFRRIITSPYVRAVETAELIAVGTGFERRLRVSRQLMPEGRPGAIVEQLIATYDKDGALALVGHEPSMGGLLSMLLQKRGLVLDKGMVVRLSLNSETKLATLEWSLTPKRGLHASL